MRSKGAAEVNMAHKIATIHRLTAENDLPNMIRIRKESKAVVAQIGEWIGLRGQQREFRRQ